MNRTQSIIFLDGQVVPEDTSVIGRLAPGVLPGKGVFETMRAYRGTLFLLEEHLKRLYTGLRTLTLTLRYTQEQLREFLYTTIQTNQLRSARVRLTVWQEKRHTHISIIAVPYRSHTASTYRRGFKVIVSSMKQNERMTKPHVKSIRYQRFLDAYQESLNKGCDEALLLNRTGHLAECSRSNLFFVKEKQLLTPTVACGCLDGITRQAVMRIAQGRGIRCKTVTARLCRLLGADEAFVTNSLIEIMPLTSVDGHRIGPGCRGPLTTRLLNAYRKLVGKNL